MFVHVSAHNWLQAKLSLVAHPKITLLPTSATIALYDFRERYNTSYRIYTINFKTEDSCCSQNQH